MLSRVFASRYALTSYVVYQLIYTGLSQLHTRKHPFPDIAVDYQVISEVSRGSRPSKPSEPTSSLDGFWEALEQCWDPETQSRPSAHSLATSLPLRIPVLSQLGPTDLSHADWKAPPPVGYHPHRDPMCTIDSCLLSFLDFSTPHGKTLHEMVERLTALGCPMDVAQSVREGAASLYSRGKQLQGRGSHRAAVECYLRAAKTQQYLARDKPNEFNSVLALSLHNLAYVFSDVGGYNAAVTYGQQAVELHRVLAQDKPNQLNSDLAISLHHLVFYFKMLGQHEDVVESGREATVLYRSLARNQFEERRRRRFVNCLQWLAFSLRVLGFVDEADQADQEAEWVGRILDYQRGSIVSILHEVVFHKSAHLSFAGF